MAQRCGDLTLGQCDWLATQYPSTPCRKASNRCQRRRRTEVERLTNAPEYTQEDLDSFAMAQQAAPSQGFFSGLLSAAGAFMNALGPGEDESVPEAEPVSTTLEEAASGSAMSIRRIKELRDAGRLHPKRPIRKKSSRRRRSARKSRRRSARKSHRRSSRRQSSRRSLY